MGKGGYSPRLGPIYCFSFVSQEPVIFGSKEIDNQTIDFKKIDYQTISDCKKLTSSQPSFGVRKKTMGPRGSYQCIFVPDGPNL